MKLHPSQKLILKAIRKNPNLMPAEIAELTGLKFDNTRYHIAKLIKAGVIRDGNRWEVL
jgi:DNA-binding MarR family transcriptional regulator